MLNAAQLDALNAIIRNYNADGVSYKLDYYPGENILSVIIRSKADEFITRVEIDERGDIS